MKRTLFIILAALLILMAFALCCHASDPVPSARLPYGGSWAGLAGVSGGIPARTSIFTNLPITANAATINAWLAACPSNSVVTIAAGTNTMDGDLFMAKDGLTLRGATNANGLPATFFNAGYTIYLGDGNHFLTGVSGDWNTVAVTAGIARGSSNVTLASIPAGCAVSNLLWFSAAPADCGWSGDTFSLFLGTDPCVMIVKVTAISGNSVSFYPPLDSAYPATLKASVSKGTVYHRMGVENIAMTGTENTYISFSGCDECWVKNCTITGSSTQTRQIYFFTCNRCEVQHSDVGGISAGGANDYALFNQDGTGIKVENCYLHNAPNFYPMMCSWHSVFAYNFITNCPYSQSPKTISQLVYCHGGFNGYPLFEGNSIPCYYHDGLTNNSNDPTITWGLTEVRDRVVTDDGSDGGKLYQTYGITILNPGYSNSIVGCLIGKVGFTQYYDKPADAVGGDWQTCYSLEGQTGLIRAGNWCAVTTEGGPGVASGEALTNGQVIANSYLYANAPSWFGNLTWPPFDPSRSSAAQMDATNLPAGYRAAFGMDPPAGAPATNPPAASGLTIYAGTVHVGH